MLLKALRIHPDCIVRYPTEDEIVKLMEAITEKHSSSEMAILQLGIISITLSYGYSQSC
jgi:hypothetical protein